jgi:hypothetical protein
VGVMSLGFRNPKLICKPWTNWVSYNSYRSAGAVQVVQGALSALTQARNSQQGGDVPIFPEDNLMEQLAEAAAATVSPKTNGLNGPELKMRKEYSGEIITNVFPDNDSNENYNDLYSDIPIYAPGSTTKGDEGLSFRPSSSSLGGILYARNVTTEA